MPPRRRVSFYFRHLHFNEGSSRSEVPGGRQQFQEVALGRSTECRTILSSLALAVLPCL